MTTTVRISVPDLVSLGVSLRGAGRTAPAACASVLRFAMYFIATASRRARVFRPGFAPLS